jgi:predicted metal-dependent hydrolase
MSTNQETIAIANVEIDVIRKDIKNMHLAVYPPTGRIRLAAPIKTDSEVVRLFAISKLGWIKKHIKNFKEQARETQRDYVSGESHYVNGKRFLLNVITYNGPTKIEYSGIKKINLYIKSDTTRETKANLMKEWYRKELKKQIPELIDKWESIIGVKASNWGIRQMRTKWGSCNTDTKKIWLNLELAKKPTICLEYILVHELVHLLERNHNEQFVKYMNEFMPKWRLYRDELNNLPVAHNDWGY